MLRSLLAGPELWLEIGYGGGEHLVAQARANPSVTIVGCEPFEEGIAKVLTAIADHGIENIRVYGDDARDLLRVLPDNALARVFVLFPDPWPKKKHQKRRLVGPHLFEMLARVVRANGELRVATDIADYARSILVSVQGQPWFTWNARGPDDWRVRGADWPQTRYEQKAIREGRPCCYLTFKRNSVPLAAQ
jgi:tRNA (guanine-N7-)-methyltransferase